MSDDLAQIRADAVWTLSQVLRWELSAARWDLLGGMLDALADAAAEADADAIAVATADLELTGPMRITPIGAAGTDWHEAPPRIRERVNELIHVLRGGASSDSDSASQADTNRAPGPKGGQG